jgi:Protein of unknown function DUF262
VKTSATNKRVRELMTALTAQTLVPQPIFQRRLVWTSVHKQQFIKTVLEGYPFPEIFLCDGETDLDTGVGTQLVVDGQQRITTLHQYFTGSTLLALGSLTPYKELSDEAKNGFLNYSVVVRDLGALSDADVREVFYRMNSTNYGLNAMEVNNARFDGPLKKLAEEVSGWDIFEEHRVFNAMDLRRMSDVKWVLTLIITIMSGYFTRDTEHEKYLRRYNDEFPDGDAMRARLRDTVSLIENLDLGPQSRAFRKTDLLTLAAEISRLDARTIIDADALGVSLRSFYAAVDAVGEGSQPEAWPAEAELYYQAVFSGNNERSRRLRRGIAMQTVLRPHFNVRDESLLFVETDDVENLSE